MLMKHDIGIAILRFELVFSSKRVQCSNTMSPIIGHIQMSESLQLHEDCLSWYLTYRLIRLNQLGSGSITYKPLSSASIPYSVPLFTLPNELLFLRTFFGNYGHFDRPRQRNHLSRHYPTSSTTSCEERARRKQH